MKPLRTYSVATRLPEQLLPLRELAYNFWFAWNNDIAELFAQADHLLWRQSNQNPVWLLNHMSEERLSELAEDELFLERLQFAKQELERYLGKTTSHFSLPRDDARPVTAYFSLEFGICPGLPVYSGGLGILAGDHLKSASDLNLPLVGVGLAYRQGYFRQYLTPDGWQQERYPGLDFDLLPITRLENEDGTPLELSVALNGNTLFFHVWKARVGRVLLYLMDTNTASNPPELRELTSRLYGGGPEHRLRQEILLGIGGMRLLAALGIEPRVVHMNEGHSAFAALERVRTLMHDHGLSFEAAEEVTASTCVFTTHTPVPAGNDRFAPDLMLRHFEGYAASMGLAGKPFLGLGREDPHDDAEPFCMTVLALKLSRFNNGVSRLHGSVSRTMWKKLWPQLPEDDVPIGDLTNGVHVPSWVAPDMGLLFDRYLGRNWREDPDCPRLWELADTIPDAELWRTHSRLRARLVDAARSRLRTQLAARGARDRDLEIADEVLSPDALTIGFARRFATYKRGNLLLEDTERFLELLADTEHPIQFVFAGKAHPQDNEGKKLIQSLVRFCQRPEVRHKVVFIEDYDMEIAQLMVQGSDIWLNTPRRPLEACGTSGMKALFNGVLNISTLDGWWDEAYLPDNSVGWSIGRGEEYADTSYQDFVESKTLYHLLANDVIPEFYDKGQAGMPRVWIRRMKKALKLLGRRFNSHRMVEEYVDNAYRPACGNHDLLAANDHAVARELAQWRMELFTRWGDVAIRNVQATNESRILSGDPLAVSCEVRLGGLAADSVRVEIYHGVLGKDGDFTTREAAAMQPGAATDDGWVRYEGEVFPRQAGGFGFTVRVVPHHTHIDNPHTLGLVRWAS